MLFSTVLPLAAALPVVLALPSTITQVNVTAECLSQQWSIDGFSTFDSPKGGVKPGTPAVFNSTHLSFLFDDPNTNTSTSCSRKLKAGAGGTVADPKHYYACVDSSVRYLYDGKTLDVTHSFYCHRKHVKAVASIEGAVDCTDRFGGRQCQTAITEVNVIPQISK